MGVQEVTTDPKTGKRTWRMLPGYEAPPKYVWQKEPNMKKKEVAPKKEAKPVEIKKPVKEVAKRAKLEFSVTVMALNDDRVLSKKSQDEIESDSVLSQAFTRWLKSGLAGGFYITRRSI